MLKHTFKYIFVFFIFISSLGADENIYAIKGGLMSHSTGPVSSGREEGIDINGEVVFKNRFLKGHPSIGMEINTNGDTSFLYGGLIWEGRFFDNLLFGGFLGFAANNGELDNDKPDRRQMGTHITFREAVEIGYHIDKNWVISIMYDHYSNLGLRGKRNQGNDNTGVRLSFYF